MNKNLPSFVPLAVVIVAAAVAGVAIVSQSGYNDQFAANQVVPSGTIRVVDEGTMNFAAAAAESVSVGQSKRVSWNTSDYPSQIVMVSVIRKVSDNPATYQTIRTLPSVPNNGTTVWTPAAGEIGSNVFVEVGCTETSKACVAHISPISYTVTQ
jgi:hypothetical protein